MEAWALTRPPAEATAEETLLIKLIPSESGCARIPRVVPPRPCARYERYTKKPKTPSSMSGTSAPKPSLLLFGIGSSSVTGMHHGELASNSPLLGHGAPGGPTDPGGGGDGLGGGGGYGIRRGGGGGGNGKDGGGGGGEGDEDGGGGGGGNGAGGGLRGG